MSRTGLALCALLACTWTNFACATEHQVRMLNHGGSGMMEFDPALLRIAPGDSVRFVATDKGHNAQSIDGMIPAGAKAFSGPMNADYSVTFIVPGIYGYRCIPHGTLGMVGLIVVGQATNEAAAKSAAMQGAAGHVFARLFQTLDSTTGK